MNSANIDNFSRLKIAENPSSPLARSADITLYSSMIIDIEEESAIEELEKIGAIIAHRRDNLLLVYLPDEMLGELDNIHKVTGVSISRKASVNLDKALPATHADDVLAGRGFAQSYTGKGVIVGFSDLGFDPGHDAFKGRVKSIFHAVDTTATIIRCEPSQWTTDSPDDFHATHVGGILAGNDANSPYKGVARGAEIVAATSTLDDVSILMGVEEIISKAKEEGKPAVINLSLGSTLGPHDGTDLFCQYLDKCAEEAAILLAAGNDGSTNIHVSGKSQMSIMVESYKWGDIMHNNGYIDVWGNNNMPIKFRLRIWDKFTNQSCWESEWIDPYNDLYVKEFDEYFEGVLLAASECSPYNNRYNLTIAQSIRALTYYPEKTWARHSLVIDFEGGENQDLEAFADGTIGFHAASSSYPFITGGNSINSISSMACGHNTIVVGSATTRDTAPLVTGGESSWAGFVDSGTISNYSSYGKTFDGRSLPHFCAPGAYIVSAFNRYALEKYPSMKSEMAFENPSGHFYYAECGTSMATPHAAGIFAIWLEANPNLSPEELREIAMSTTHTNGIDPLNPRSGAGMIDASAGLAKILKDQGIASVEAISLNIWKVGNKLAISGCTDENVKVAIYNISGILIYDGVIDNAIIPENTPLIVKVYSDSFSLVRKLI